jgi:hypothetical protein
LILLSFRTKGIGNETKCELLKLSVTLKENQIMKTKKKTTTKKYLLRCGFWEKYTVYTDHIVAQQRFSSPARQISAAERECGFSLRRS